MAELVAAVDLDLALVVDPRHAEHDHALGLDEALEKGVLLVLGVGVERGLQGLEDLLCRLDELGLLGIAGLELGDDLLGIRHEILPSPAAAAATKVPEERIRARNTSVQIEPTKCNGIEPRA